MIDRASSPIVDFLQRSLVGGPVGVPELEAKARAAGLLGKRQPKCATSRVAGKPGRKPRHHDEWDPPITSYDPYLRGRVADDKVIET